MNLLYQIKKHDELDDKIRTYLYPKVYTLYNERKLKCFEKIKEEDIFLKAEQSVTIKRFSVNKDKVIVGVDIWLGGQWYEFEHVIFTNQEWAEIYNS